MIAHLLIWHSLSPTWRLTCILFSCCSFIIKWLPIGSTSVKITVTDRDKLEMDSLKLMQLRIYFPFLYPARINYSLGWYKMIWELSSYIVCGLNTHDRQWNRCFYTSDWFIWLVKAHLWLQKTHSCSIMGTIWECIWISFNKPPLAVVFYVWLIDWGTFQRY